MLGFTPVAQAVDSYQDIDPDAFEEQLDELDERIQAHLRRAKEAAFWTPEHTAARPVFERKKPSEPEGRRRMATTPTAPIHPIEEERATSRTKVSGKYRLAFGGGRSRTFSFNDSNSDFQDRDSNYLFGERLNNTFDHEIYSQYQLDIEADINAHTDFYAQFVADPWSYVGVTREVEIRDQASTDTLRTQLKYWGPNNSTIPERFRTPNRDLLDLSRAEAKNGEVAPFSTFGFSFPFFQRQFNIPALDIDYEFRPLRKIWTDYNIADWKIRVFGLADQNQVMTTDDPLGLSNSKDYWEDSPWLSQWQPIEVMHDGTTSSTAIRRGHYDNAEAFIAKDSHGNYLTLLRGVAVEGQVGPTYLGAMVASRFGLWDEYHEVDNIPGVVRLKHQLTPDLMIGGLYGFRLGMIDREPDAKTHIYSVDTQYDLNETDYLYSQYAYSTHEIDRRSSFPSDHQGSAFRAGFVSEPENFIIPNTKLHGDFAWMDTKFQPVLSRYNALADDEYWSRQITFAKTPPDIEPFRLGTGLDRGRYVGRLRALTEFEEEGLTHLFDARHVRDPDDNSYIETVLRSELDYQVVPEIMVKTFARWHHLPGTESDVEPYMPFFEAGSPLRLQVDDPALDTIELENVNIDQGLDPSRQTFGVGVEYQPWQQWTFDASYSRTNDIPEFPRGLMFDEFLDAVIADPNDPNIKLDVVQPFLFGQYVFDLPPYDYFSIIKERVVYKHTPDLKFIFHAAQNSYKLWGPVDENVNHQGVSMDYQITDKWAFFMDYTHSVVADIPHLIATLDSPTPELTYKDHHNIYAALTYQINASTLLNMEYGVYGNTLYEGSQAIPTNPFAISTLNLPTIDTEHLFRLSLEGEF